VDGDAEFVRLCRLMEHPGLAGDPRFTTHAARKENEDALDEFVREWTAGQDRWDLAARLQASGLAAAPVENLQDTYERDPQLRHHYQRVRHPLAPDVELPIDREVIRFEGVDHAVRRGPMWGEHNEEIVREVLGIGEEEYTRLVLDEVLV
jgi:crotonobetainyl-CoA:carnitine CoA-transferase CaiB-like acyl-CoA transferase